MEVYLGLLHRDDFVLECVRSCENWEHLTDADPHVAVADNRVRPCGLRRAQLQNLRITV